VTSQGTGFFISSDGYAVTNHHVVKNAKTVEVRTDDEKPYTARVVGIDPTSDLALLKIDCDRDFPYATFDDSPPRVGDWIIAVGNPFGLGGTVTAGIVSARGRDVANGGYEDLIQIDAPVNKGNSGGPTFNLRGRVIGINTMIFSPNGGSIGIAFNITARRAQRVIAELRDNGTVTWGWLGVQIQGVSPEIAETLGLPSSAGVLIAEAVANGPAAAAGVAAGDLVHSINGETVANSHDFGRMVDAARPGNPIELDVMRRGQRLIIMAQVGQRPETQGRAMLRTEEAADQTTRNDSGLLGLAMAPANGTVGPGLGGVLVMEIDPRSIAADRGIEVGDIILDVASQPVTTPEDVQVAFAKARLAGRHTVLVRIKSGQKTQFIALPIG
jgi:serine protease Do